MQWLEPALSARGSRDPAMLEPARVQRSSSNSDNLPVPLASSGGARSLTGISRFGGHDWK